MSRRERRSTNSVSLFPFLAVLVCAMGALILLLLVTTRRIRSEAIARAQTTVEQSVDSVVVEEPATDAVEAVEAPDTPDPLEKTRERIHHLAQQRDERRAALEAQQTDVDSTKRHMRELDASLQDIGARLHGAKQQLLQCAERVRSAHKENVELSDRIAETTARIRHVRERKSQTSSKFALVPFDAKTGTTRRPILIECTAAGLRFLPEDVLLTESDLIGFIEGYNPLLAGTRALVEFWSKHDRRTAVTASSAGRDADAEEPYVLLIVRPSGSVPFYAARKLLGHLEQPSGYELLPEGLELDLPEADAAAKAALRRAITEVLEEREKLQRALTAARERSRPGGRAAEGRGGLDSSGGFERSGGTNQPGGFYEETLEQNREVPPLAGPRPPFPGTRESGGGRTATGGERIPTAVASNDGQPRMRDSSVADRTTSHSGGGNQSAAQEQASSLNAEQFPRGKAPPPGFEVSSRPGRGAGVEHPAPAASGSAGADPSLLPEEQPLGASPHDEDARSNARSPASSTRPSAAPQKSSSPSQASPLQPSQVPFPEFGERSDSQASSRPSRFDQADRRWGGSGRRGNIGLEREMTIRVDADRLIIGREILIKAPGTLTREELLAQTTAAIDEYARSWGQPPDNFYWVPSVRFVVSPGGNQYYERLHGPLGRWGVRSRVEFALESADGRSNQE